MTTVGSFCGSGFNVFYTLTMLNSNPNKNINIKDIW